MTAKGAVAQAVDVILQRNGSTSSSNDVQTHVTAATLQRAYQLTLHLT
jgi:hypothetical protein